MLCNMAIYDNLSLFKSSITFKVYHILHSIVDDQSAVFNLVSYYYEFMHKLCSYYYKIYK